MESVRRFYDENPDEEWDRHDTKRMEFAVTMRAFADHLPPPPAHVLDVGGGPGRYAVALAAKGYDVTLVDLSPRCLELARLKAAEATVAISGYVQADAVDLKAFDSGSFDALLLMGPMYHLTQANDRVRALTEARRLLKPSGTVLVTFIAHYAAIRFAAKSEPTLLVDNPDWCEEPLQTGVFKPLPGRGFGSFTDAYLSHPNAILPLMEEAGFEARALIACEGVVSMIDEQVNRLRGEAWDAWVELSYRLGHDPSVHGTTEHLLYVGTRP